MLKSFSFNSLILIGLSSCFKAPEFARQPLSAEEQFAKGKAVKTYHANLPDFIVVPPLEERRKLFIAGINVSSKSVNGDWHVADQRVRDHLARYEAHPLLYAEAQLYSAIMLDQFLLSEKTNRQVLETIGYYLDLLDYYQSNEYVIISQSLQKLRDYWPDAKIKEVALRAYIRANHLLQSENSSPVTSALYKQNQQLIEGARQSHLALNKLAHHK